jgi:hypothetical protein
MDFYDVVSTAWTNRHSTDPVPTRYWPRSTRAIRSSGRQSPARAVHRRSRSVSEQLKNGTCSRGRPIWPQNKAVLAAKARSGASPGRHFAEHLDRSRCTSWCRELDGSTRPTSSGRLSIVGGGSVYPAVQNFLLGCRNEGPAPLTTLLCVFEKEVKELLNLTASSRRR